MKGVLTILWKDILLELRTRDIIGTVFLFGLLIMIVFSFAFEAGSQAVVQIAPGIVWAAFTFAAVLALNRSFSLEKDRGSLEGLLLCPVDREVVYVGKMLSNFLFILIVEAISLPIFGVFLNLPIFEPRLVLVIVLTTLGFSAVGTLFSAVASNTKVREIMLPLLFFPIVVPLIISAVKLTTMVLKDASWSEMSSWLQLTIACNIIFLVVSTLTFSFTMEE